MKHTKKQLSIASSLKSQMLGLLLAGWDCLENRNIKPTIINLRQTDYFWEFIGMLKSYCAVLENEDVDFRQNLEKELIDFSEKLVKNSGCKRAYFFYNNHKSPDYSKTFTELMECGYKDHAEWRERKELVSKPNMTLEQFTDKINEEFAHNRFKNMFLHSKLFPKFKNINKWFRQ